MTTKISVYNLDSSVTTAISAGGGPKIQTIVYPGNDTAVSTSGGDVVILNGSGFVTGCTIIVNGSSAGSVTFNSSSNVQFTAPAQSSGGYPIYLVNPDGGTAIAVPGLQYSGVPAWTTAAGSLGTIYETTAFANTVVALGDVPITYNVASGTLPPGASLNVSSGLISGTSNLTSSSTTYNFTIRATDAQYQDTDRAFSLTVNPDVVTWSSPANNVVYSVFQDQAISNVSLAATSAAGYGVQYAANTLPTGLTLSGNTISGTPSVLGNTNTLVTATANTTTRTAQQIINWVVSAGFDTYFEYVTTLLSANNSVNNFVDDTSTNNFAISVFGDTKPSNFNPHTPGYYSNYFDGTGDEITWSGTTIGTSQYTFECWFYHTGTISGVGVFGCAAVTGGFNVRLTNTTVVQVDAYNTSGTQFTVPTMVAGRWHHLAVCRGASNQTTVFLNGVRSSTGAVAISTNYSAATRIGTSQDLSNFTGYISNARLIVGNALYDPTQTTITVPTSPLTAIANTNLLACQSNRFIDNSNNNFTLTKVGDTTINAFDPFLPNTSYATYGSTYFDGSGDYLATAASSNLNCGTNPFTIECWVYIPSNPSTLYPSIVSSTNWNTGTGGVSLRYGNTGYANKFTFHWYNIGDPFLASSSTFTLNTWHHVAVTRSGNSFTLWVNGTSQATGTNAGTVDWNLSSAGMKIGGGNWDGANSYYIGYINNLRLVNGTAVYTGAFTPPTTPLTAIANTQLLTCQTNLPVNNQTFIDNSTNNYLITRAGNTTQGTFSPYGAGWSNYFDGTGDWLTGTLALGSGNFTEEAWVYQTVAANATLWDTRGANPSATGLSVEIQNSTRKIQLWSGDGSNPLFTSTGTFPVNTWTHIAVVRNSGVITVYINGTSSGTVSTSQNFSDSSLVIGSNNPRSASWTGYISNLRISNTTAFYTGNFTPSTSPLQSIANTSLLTCQSPRFIDSGPTNLTLTRSGDVSIQKFNPFNLTTLPTPYYSAYFDGTGDFLSIGGSGAWGALSTGNFTVECWIYIPSNSAIQIIADTRNSTTNIPWQMYTSATGKLVFASGATIIATGATTIPINTWTHVAVVRSGTTITLYVNGTSDATATNSSNLSGGTTTYIGRTADTTGTLYYTGYISNFRTVLGQAVYTSAFTPSTTPLTAISGTSLLTCQSETFVDNSTNKYAITNNGDTRPTTVNPFTLSYSTNQQYSTSVIGGSMYFDGTGDYLTTPVFGSGNGSGLFVASSSFTVEAWLYQTAYVSTAGYVNAIIGDLTPTAATALWWAIGTDSSNAPVFRWFDGVVKTYTGNTALGLYRWNHVAFVCNAGALSIYVNGILQTSSGTSTITTPTGTQSSLIVGADRGYYVTGYMSDVRVMRGTTNYTSNFVPPLAPVQSISNTSLLLSGTSAGIFDASGVSEIETLGDVRINTAVTKFSSGSSIAFDGTGDYLLVKPTPDLEFGSGDFTLEFWWYPTSTVRQALYHASFGTDYSLGIDYSSVGTNKIGVYASSNGTTWNLLNADAGGNFIGTITPTQNAWNHIALVRNGNNWILFVNGTLDKSATVSGTIVNRATSQKGIGVWWSTGSFSQVFGYMSDFRITKGYARYTASFTPTTTPFISK
jgi:hypothetical protein